MNTMFLLMAEFETSQIPLAKVCDKYLDISESVAKRRASTHELPFPVYRAGSNKSQYLVNISDLADYLDRQREAARKEWKLFNAA